MGKFCLLIIMSIMLYGQTITYRWPIPGGFKDVISTYCDYRPASSPPHFHEGIDIRSPLSEDVQCITKNFQLMALPDSGYDGWIVYVRHYTEDSAMAACNHGSRYIHMYDVNDTLNRTDTVYQNVYISHQTDFKDNHLHLEYRRIPVGGDEGTSLNPFLIDELVSNDNYSPTLNALYVDNVTRGDADVECLNFLGYEFDSLYKDTTYQSVTYKKLTLPIETPDNDMDDPHILIGGNCKVRFVLGGHDNLYATTDIAAPYEFAIYLDTNIVNLLNPHYHVIFDSLLGSTDEVHQEEDVYHVEPPLISSINAPQYYRLYPFDSAGNGLPGCIITQGTVLETENLEEGMHRIRVYARDFETHTKTGDVHFYILKSNWVDFCRGFKE